MTYSEICEMIIVQLTNIAQPDEIIWTDEECYESNLAVLGMEEHRDQFYPELEALKIMPAGQCYAGTIGAHVLREVIKVVDPAIAPAYERAMAGHIHYYVGIMSLILCRMVEIGDIDEVTPGRVAAMVTYVVAHERRHSHQPLELLDANWYEAGQNIQPLVYLNLSHEQDADSFARAVVDGIACLEDAAIWNSAA